MYQNITIIAEVKTQSPFGYTSEKSWDGLFRIAEKIGDIISVHTDPRWGGSFEILRRARALSRKPILAKGIHATDGEIKKAVDLGADWVLVVGRIPKVYIGRCIIEPLDLKELKTIPEDFRIVWNARDLANGNLKTETFAEARKIFKGWLCQASYIKTVADIQKEAQAVLVGTHLCNFAQFLG